MSGPSFSGLITALARLTTDVSISSPASGQVLTYNGSKWANAAAPLNPVNVSASSPVTTAYTLVSADAYYCVEVNSATAVNVTVPASVFSAGTVLEIFQLGAGQVTVVAGSGVSFQSDAGKVKCAAQYATVGLRFRTGGASPVVALSGDLA